MKRTFTLLFSCFLLSAAFGATPVLDGVISPTDGWGTAVSTSDGTAGWNGTNAKTLYVTYDDNYVYFAAEVNADSWMSWAFIVNTKAGGATNDSWSRQIAYNHANLPDYTFRGTFGGYAEYHSWNGTGWDGFTERANTDYAESVTGTADGAVEIRVPRSMLGDNVMGDVQFYITGNVNDHGSFDAVPNDNNAAGWNPPASSTTLSNYAANVPLPVKLVDFKAIKDKGNVLLNWTVAQETNIEGYQIQRSQDGVNFTTIQHVTARNQSAAQPTYAAADANAHKGVNYYRLAIKENGRQAFSKVVKVTMGQKAGNIIINYPPGSTKLNIKLVGADAGVYGLSVVSSVGQLLQTINFNHDGQEVTRSINLKAGLSKGIYRVVLLNNNVRTSQAFLVQ